MAENAENAENQTPGNGEIDGANLSRQVSEDGKKAYRLKNLIRIFSIVIALIILMLLIIYGATVIANYQKSYPVRVGGDSEAISLCESGEMNEPTTHLDMPVTTQLDPMSAANIPSDIDSRGGGSHNGEQYLAYTFYARNNVDADAEIRETISIVSSTKHADKALRVRVYRNGVSTTYAAASAVGTPEYGTVPFADKETVVDQTLAWEKGQIIQYTIVIWIEGDDPECVNEIGGGTVRVCIDFRVSGD